jgi:hypothetical protein
MRRPELKLRKIFGCKKLKVRGSWKKLNSKVKAIPLHAWTGP